MGSWVWLNLSKVSSEHFHCKARPHPTSISTQYNNPSSISLLPYMWRAEQLPLSCQAMWGLQTKTAPRFFILDNYTGFPESLYLRSIAAQTTRNPTMIQRGYKVEVNLHREVSETRLNPMKDYKYFLWIFATLLRKGKRTQREKKSMSKM